MSKKYFTVTEAATMAGVNKETIRRNIRSGKLKAIRIGSGIHGKGAKFAIYSKDLKNWIDTTGHGRFEDSELYSVLKPVDSIRMTEKELYIISIVMTYFQNDYLDYEGSDFNKSFVEGFETALAKVNSCLTQNQVNRIKDAFSDFYSDEKLS